MKPYKTVKSTYRNVSVKPTVLICCAFIRGKTINSKIERVIIYFGCCLQTKAMINYTAESLRV